MGLPLVVYTRRFDPVREMQPECAPNWLSNAEPLFGNNSLHSLCYSVIRINICQNNSDDAQRVCIIKRNSAFCESLIIWGHGYTKQGIFFSFYCWELDDKVKATRVFVLIMEPICFCPTVIYLTKNTFQAIFLFNYKSYFINLKTPKCKTSLLR